MTTRLIASGLLATLLLLGIVLAPTKLLVVRSERESIDICQRVAAGEPVTVIFTNSMFGGEVRETYVISDDALMRISFVTENEAAAEYYAWTSPVEKTTAGYEVMLEAQSFASIPILVDIIGAYTLTIGDATFHLSQTIESPTSITVDVESSSLITGWARGC